MDGKGETAPALGISLNAQFAAGRQLVFQTHIDRDTDATVIGSLVAKWNDVIDIEEAYYSLPELEKSVEVNKNQLYLINQQLGEIDRRQRVTDRGRTVPLSAKDQADRSNALKSKERAEELLKKSQDLLDETRKKVANRDGTASAADR